MRARVLDRGGGVEPGLLERVFEPGVTTKARGSGLGLTIARDLVTAHGGRLEVESKLGRGSKFTIRLPLQSCQGTKLIAA